MSYDLRQIESSRDDRMPREAAFISVTSFFGGEVDGRCLQLTLHNDFIGLTEKDVRRLMTTLAVWLDPDISGQKASELFERVEA